MKSKQGGFILVFLFIIWIMLICYCGEVADFLHINIYSYLFLSTGFFVFIFGLLAIIFNKVVNLTFLHKIYPYCASIFGFLLLLVGIISIINNRISIDLLFIGFLSLFCFMIFIISIINNKQLKQNCTLLLSGEVVNVKEFTTDIDQITYTPVFKIYYNNTYQEICNNKGNLLNNMKIGEVYNLYVNPNNFNEYYIANDNNHKYVELISFIGMISCIIYIICRILGGRL